MNLFKLITRSGRQSLARDLLKEYITTQSVARWAADGVNRLLANVNDKAKLATIAGGVNHAADITSEIASAVRDGHIDGQEAQGIAGRVLTLVDDAVDEAALERIIEKAVALVP